MEVGKKFEEDTENVVIAKNTKKESPKGTKWIRNQADGSKQCDACGAVMHGWASREPFKFCPKCGAMAEVEE